MPLCQEEKRKRRVRSEKGALFLLRRQEKEADQGIRRKRLYKTKGLCYSIEEADSVLDRRFSGTASAGANGRNMSANESFNNGWRDITKKELSADMYGDREVGFVSMLCVGFGEDHGRGDQFGKVVHDQSGKDLLVDELHLFRMKVKQAEGVFQFPEGGFNAPAHMIELLQFQGRKRFRIQIGENGFIGILCNLKSNNAKGQVIENDGIVLAVIAGKEVKGSHGGNNTILVSALA